MVKKSAKKSGNHRPISKTGPRRPEKGRKTQNTTSKNRTNTNAI